MKPDFALSLSFEGVGLLYRQKGSWANVGYVDLAADNLNEQLSQLKQKGQRVSGGTFYSKLVIPNEQIRYIVVVYSEQKSATDLQVETALTGATPYSVSDLVYDWEIRAGQLYIAAVAKETLEEAEQFACKYSFNPVRFVATPAQNTLQREIDFGTCRAAESLLPTGIKTIRDKAVITISGQVSDPTIKTRSRQLTMVSPAADRMDEVCPPKEPIKSEALSKNNLTTGHFAGVSDSKPYRGSTEPDDLTVSPALLVTNFASEDMPRSSTPNLILTLGSVLLLSGIAVWMFALTGSGFLPSHKRLTDTGAQKTIVSNTEDMLGTSSQLPRLGASKSHDIDFPDDEAAADLFMLEGSLPFAEGPIRISEEQAKVHHAASGVWLRAPPTPDPGQNLFADDLYAASIDLKILSHDAVALPFPPSKRVDIAPKQQADPPNFGQTFKLNSLGLVVATKGGSPSPEGYMVYLGKPKIISPARVENMSVFDPDIGQLAKRRPLLRPINLVDNAERLQLGGRTRAELKLLRPKLRPASLRDTATTFETNLASANATRTPKLRPIDLQAASSEPESRPRAVSLANNATVAQKATLIKALDLRKVNLIGVYGTSSNRRALVRLSSGRYKKVEVGDRIDGGRVAAIGRSQLRYTKSGRNIVLKMPPI